MFILLFSFSLYSLSNTLFNLVRHALVFLKFVQHRNIINILCLDPRLIHIKNINLDNEPHLYKSSSYGVYMVQVDDKWVPALNITFGIYNGDTLITGIPRTINPPKFLQQRVFITLSHGGF